MTTAKLPMHTVNLAKEKGHEFTQAEMMKMLAERNQRHHAGSIYNRFAWEEALLTCFGNHSRAGGQRLL